MNFLWHLATRALYFSGVLTILATMSSAQNYPEYDGVYLRMQDGSFVGLPITQSNGGTRSVQFHLGGMHSNALRQAFFGYEDFEPFPIVEIEKIEGIVVVGPQVNDVRLFSLAEVTERYKEYFDNSSATATYTHGGLTQEIRALDLPPIFARQTCGTGPEFMRVRRISEFVAEFSLKPEFRPKNGGFDSRSWVLAADGSCRETGKLAVAFEILVNEDYRASFRNKRGVDSFLSRNGMRTDTDNPSGGASAPKSSPVEKSQNLSELPNGYFQPSTVRCAGDILEQGIEMDRLSKSIRFYSFACTAMAVGINASGEMNWKLDCYSDEGGQRTAFERNLRLKVSSEDRIYVNGQPFKRCYLN